MAKRHKIQKDERNGNFFVRIQVAGTRKYFNLGPRLKEARRELARLEKRITRGQEDFSDHPVGNADAPTAAPADPAKDPLLSELVAAHLKWVSDNRAPSTARLFEMYEQYFLNFVGDRPVSTITRLMLENFFAWGRDNHSKSQNGGIVFVRHVKTMFLWAEEMDICPCPVKKFPKVTETPPATKRFSDEELRKLLTTVPPEFADFRDMIVFGLHTGLRPQELRELTRDQLHDDPPQALQAGGPAATVRIEPKSVVRSCSSRPARRNGHGGPYTKSVFPPQAPRCSASRRAGRQPTPARHIGSTATFGRVNQTVIAQTSPPQCDSFGRMMGPPKGQSPMRRVNHTQLRTTSRYIANNAEHHRNAIQAVGSRVAKLGAILLLLASTAQAACFTGRVERVIDGDTIIARVVSVATNTTNRACPLAYGSLQRVRLTEIDAPELKEPYGQEARQALSDMILGKTVRVEWKRRGRYRRIIGQVYSEDEWVNCAMISKGWAKQFRRYSRSRVLAEAELAARGGRAGMWRRLGQL
jgi:endonuclease YncB( thermonuclease family)